MHSFPSKIKSLNGLSQIKSLLLLFQFCGRKESSRQTRILLFNKCMYKITWWLTRVQSREKPENNSPELKFVSFF